MEEVFQVGPFSSEIFLCLFINLCVCVCVLTRTIFKVFIELVTILLVFCVVSFWL